MRSISAADAELDAVVSVQVLEYIADVDAAVVELARVTRSVGRFVNVATNWGALFWHGADPELTGRVMRAWAGHAPHPNLPVTLPSLLDASGFGAAWQRPVTIVNRRVHPHTLAWNASQLIAAFVHGTGAVSDDDLDTWLQGLRDADRCSRAVGRTRGRGS